MKSQLLIALKNAKKIINKPSKWTKEAFGRTYDGTKVGWTNDNAVCWCSFGAINRTSAHDPEYEKIIKLLTLAANELGYGGIVELNDETDHATVMKMFDIAIRKVKKENL